MSLASEVGPGAIQSQYDWHEVRFIGAIAGRYVMSDRKEETSGKLPAYACRLRSISTRRAIVIGPVVGELGELITAHFDDFGIQRGHVARKMSSGFALDLQLTAAERDKLGDKIVWQKKRVFERVPDKREHKRILPRDPRTLITLADGTRIPCFIIDVSQSGVAVSAPMSPKLGMPMAVGRLVGRVVRLLDVGFALQFVHLQPPERLEVLLKPPA